MGWEDFQQYHFIIDEKAYYFTCNANPDANTCQPSRILLKEVFTTPQKLCEYYYGFEDEWKCSIKLEDITLKNQETFYPVCIDGQYNSPPEDCGGCTEYQFLLETIEEEDNEEYEDAIEWLGCSFDPDEFDINLVNERLRAFDLYHEKDDYWIDSNHLVESPPS